MSRILILFIVLILSFASYQRLALADAGMMEMSLPMPTPIIEPNPFLELPPNDRETPLERCIKGVYQRSADCTQRAGNDSRLMENCNWQFLMESLGCDCMKMPMPLHCTDSCEASYKICGYHAEKDAFDLERLGFSIEQVSAYRTSMEKNCEEERKRCSTKLLPGPNPMESPLPTPFPAP